MRKYSIDEAIDIGNRVINATSVLVGAAVAFAVGVVLVRLLWTSTIPDLFPVAVAQGLISDDLTWLAALKLVATVAILNSTGMLIADKWRR